MGKKKTNTTVNRKTIDWLKKHYPVHMKKWGEQLAFAFGKINDLDDCITRIASGVYTGHSKNGKKTNPLDDIARVDNLDEESEKLAAAINRLASLTHEANSYATSKGLLPIVSDSLKREDLFFVLLENYGVENASTLLASGILKMILEKHDENEKAAI